MGDVAGLMSAVRRPFKNFKQKKKAGERRNEGTADARGIVARLRLGKAKAGDGESNGGAGSGSAGNGSAGNGGGGRRSDRSATTPASVSS